MNIFYCPSKYNMVLDTFSLISMDSVEHVEDEMRESSNMLF